MCVRLHLRSHVPLPPYRQDLSLSGNKVSNAGKKAIKAAASRRSISCGI